MFEEMRDAAPIVLIPAAWTAVGAVQFGHMGETGIFVAHVVMAVFITLFAVTGWNQMATGALRIWRSVLVVGLVLTLAGLAGFLGPAFEDLLHAVSLVGWMILPALGLAYTGRELPAARLQYVGGAALSLAGAALYLGTLAGLAESLAALAIALVGVGQTVGIVDAARR
jgi:hypothetical protein